MRLASLPLALIAAIAFGEEAHVYTNKDLPEAKKPAAGAKVVTNEDLARSDGNLTYTDPADDRSYEADLPAPAYDEAAVARDQRIATLKARYQELRRRQDEIEAELPSVREAASKEFGAAFIMINGIPYKIHTVAMDAGPSSIELKKLERELAKVQVEIDDIEHAAKRQYDLGRPGLMQR